jgi:hypothetical protein
MFRIRDIYPTPEMYSILKIPHVRQAVILKYYAITFMNILHFLNNFHHKKLQNITAFLILHGRHVDLNLKSISIRKCSIPSFVG